jgi:hypothetical protein
MVNIDNKNKNVPYTRKNPENETLARYMDALANG